MFADAKKKRKPGQDAKYSNSEILGVNRTMAFAKNKCEGPGNSFVSNAVDLRNKSVNKNSSPAYVYYVLDWHVP